MKLSATPISSPGRTDKFPPPLMRFLRSNVGSKSRGRSRSSPMFVRKKCNAAAAVETQEPSSPKVTCMGQVRVRHSSSVASSRGPGPGRSRRPGAAPTRKQRIRNALFCGVDGKTKPKKKSSSSSCGQLWRKWVPPFGYCRKGRVEEDPPKVIEARIHVQEEVQSFRSDEEEHEQAEFERKAKAFAASCSSSPPNNALLLTRCRSAPYRSSSLASRLCGSPNRATQEEEEQSIEPENRENERPTSETEFISDQESRTEQQDEQKIEFFKGLERSIRERLHESPSVEEEESKEEPLILTRCKSEPPRTAAVFAIN